MHPDGSPDLSVIVPSVNGWRDLEGCLGALLSQEGAARLEVLVIDRVGAEVRERAGRLDPRIVVLAAEPDTSIPHLRAMGFGRARAEVVGVVEDHVLVPKDWADRMLAAHRARAEVVGGGVDNAATSSVVDWAAFLCEYSHCLTPPPAGPAPWLTGNNVTYRRTLLERFADVSARGGWENELHDALRAAGVTLLSRPDLRVAHKMHYTVAGYARQRYLYSRSFAGSRLVTAGIGRRLLYGLATLVLPPVLLWRTVTRVWRSGRHRAKVLQAIPLLALFVLVWAVGELAGAWFGPGRSLAKVR